MWQNCLVVVVVVVVEEEDEEVAAETGIERGRARVCYCFCGVRISVDACIRHVVHACQHDASPALSENQHLANILLLYYPNRTNAFNRRGDCKPVWPGCCGRWSADWTQPHRLVPVQERRDIRQVQGVRCSLTRSYCLYFAVSITVSSFLSSAPMRAQIYTHIRTHARTPPPG